MAHDKTKANLSLTEFVDDIADFFGNNELKMIAASLKLDDEERERFEKVKRIVRQTLDPGSYAMIQIFKVFKDERPHGWQDIKKAADVSKVTLNKKLKELTKGGVLKRYVIASFPPRTQYELNQEKDADVYKVLINLGKILYHSEDAVKKTLGFYIAVDHLAQTNKTEQVDVNATEKVIKTFLEENLRSLSSDVHRPLSSFLESWQPLMATHTTYTLMLWYWAIVEVTTLNPKIKNMAESLLTIVSDELRRNPSEMVAHTD
jgi:DNA-binding HxlR family transcriptional regulator